MAASLVQKLRVDQELVGHCQAWTICGGFLVFVTSLRSYVIGTQFLWLAQGTGDLAP